MKKSLTILMPLAGECIYLESCLNSISLSILTEQIKLVIVDDGIAVNGKQILNRFALNYRTTVIKNMGHGLVDALNTGIDFTNTDFLARMDGDDLVLPGRFLKQLEILELRNDLVAVGGQAISIDRTGRDLGPVRFPIGSTNIKNQLRHRSCLPHPGTMFRLSALRQVGGYRNFFESAEDYDLFLRLSEIGNLDNLDEPVIRYRIHSGQTSLEKSEMQYLASCASVIAANNRSLKQYEISDRFFDLQGWQGSLKTLEKNEKAMYTLKFRFRLEFLIQRASRENKEMNRIILGLLFLICSPKRFAKVVQQKYVR